MSRRYQFSTLAVHLLAMAMAGAVSGGAATADDIGGIGVEIETDLDTVVAQRMNVNDSAAESQTRIDELSSQTDATIAVYRNTNQRINALRTYNHQLEEVIRSQEVELAGLRGEIDEVELIAREVTPLMLGMIDALDNFVELDVPFLAEERAVRIADLRKLMVRSDVTDAERYRRIVEAYQIENEYGRTIEAYQGDLELDGKARRVEFLRVGRIALLYQTLDTSETGVWDHRNREWKDAADSRSAVRKGIRVARKQTAPDLLKVPVPAAEATK